MASNNRDFEKVLETKMGRNCKITVFYKFSCPFVICLPVIVWVSSCTFY